jgi:hypothetical protein
VVLYFFLLSVAYPTRYTALISFFVLPALLLRSARIAAACRFAEFRRLVISSLFILQSRAHLFAHLMLAKPCNVQP